jgi:hypothetical protein
MGFYAMISVDLHGPPWVNSGFARYLEGTHLWTKAFTDTTWFSHFMWSGWTRETIIDTVKKQVAAAARKAGVASYDLAITVGLFPHQERGITP